MKPEKIITDGRWFGKHSLAAELELCYCKLNDRLKFFPKKSINWQIAHA